MNILLTGGTGYVGFHVAQRLKNEGHGLAVLTRKSSDTARLAANGISSIADPEDTGTLREWLERHAIDGIVHLAALVISEGSKGEIAALVESNITFGTRLLEAASGAKVKWFLNSGTFWQHYESAAYSPVNLYAASKQAFEDIGRHYAENTGLNFATAKLYDTYGPRDTRPKLISQLLLSLKNDTPLPMTEGNQLMDLCHVDDVATAYSSLCSLLHEDHERVHRNLSFRISSGAPVSVKQLTQTLEGVAQKKINIKWGMKEYRPREMFHWWQCGQAIPGWKPTTDLETGLRQILHDG